jgi:hypothetical protein
MGLLARLFGGDKRNTKLTAWAKTIPVSENQRVAMNKIWQAVKSKISPQGAPLSQLNDDDLSYVLKICGSDFRPPEFGSADVLRLSTFRYLKDIGFSDTEAAIGVGMMFNFVARDDV